MLVWLDTETTGLHPNDIILEVGIIITDDDLTPQAERNWLIVPPRAALHALARRTHGVTTRWANLDPHVIDMHERSGLTAELASGHGYRLPEAERNIRQWLDQHDQPGRQPMCGANIPFDRNVLQRWMPHVADWFHYRNIDVSTLRELARRWAPDLETPKTGTHRAIPDCRDAITQLDHLATHNFIWKPR